MESLAFNTIDSHRQARATPAGAYKWNDIMPELTLCMPSKRDLAGSRVAIESALAYCRARDALLVIADNSGDAEKQAYLETIGAPLIYIKSDKGDILGNVNESLRAAPTAFIMPIGDDDEILVNQEHPAFDLSELPFDYVGVLPHTIPFSPGLGLERDKQFDVASDVAGQRILSYMQNANGDNGSYYAVYRRDVFVSLVHLFTEAHPTRGGYCDWAMVLALAAYGKLAYDPSTIYRYNMENWDTAEKIERTNVEFFVRAGLPADSGKYAQLLQFLDLFIFATRSGTPLAQEERQRLGKDIVNILLGGFVQQVADAPEDYDGTLRHLAGMVLDEQDSFTQFQIGIMMADRVQPGLKDRYVEFVKRAFAA